MKDKIERIIESLFSIFIILAVLGGGVIFIMFMLALIIGGGTGEVLATKASKQIMPYFIRSAAIAMFFGLIWFYIHGRHALSLNEKK